MVDLHRLFYRYFQCPIATEAYISFACCCMDVNAQSACRGFSFQERHMLMGFRVFQCYSQIKDMGIENESVVRYVKILDLVVRFCIQDMVFVGGHTLSQMDVIRIAAKTVFIKRRDFDGPLLHLFQDPFVGENHSVLFPFEFRQRPEEQELIFSTKCEQPNEYLYPMPMLIHEDLRTHAYGLWKIEEPAAFFESRISYRAPASHHEKKTQQLASRMVLDCLHEGFPFEEVMVEERGKPVLKDSDLHFSLSHCKGHAAAIVSTLREVGIDVEEISERVLRIEKKFLQPEELGLVSGCSDDSKKEILTLFWSVKETVYKWWGKGDLDFAKHIQIRSVEGEHAGSVMVHFSPLPSSILHVQFVRKDQLWLTFLCRGHFNPA